MKIIAISNHKGGTGKSTASCNIGVALSLEKKRTLIVDLDAQANSSMAFGIKAPSRHIYGSFKGEYALDSVAIKISDLLHIIPSCLDLGAAEIELNAGKGGELILKELLAPVCGKYDYCLVDCPPNLGLLTINALTASHQLLIPLQPEYFAAQGLAKIQEIVWKIKKRFNPSLEIGGIFISRFDARKCLAKAVLASVESGFPGKVFETKVRECIALSEAQLKGMDIFLYAPKSSGASDYTKLTKELLWRME